jgi:2-oxoglutarate ferredoxin oxidoreductase subunit gamma
MTWEVKFSGFGGQGIVRCALISGKALSMYDNKFATMTQSFGPEARGGACASQLVISESRVLYPYVTRPGILITLSQDAHDTYEPQLRDGGILLYEEDLVKPREDSGRVQLYPAPVTRMAEEIGNRIFANLVTLGCFSAITKIVSAEAMKQALPGLVPDRFLAVNEKALDRGYEFGLELVEKRPLRGGDAP